MTPYQTINFVNILVKLSLIAKTRTFNVYKRVKILYKKQIKNKLKLVFKSFLPIQFKDGPSEGLENVPKSSNYTLNTLFSSKIENKLIMGMESYLLDALTESNVSKLGLQVE